MRALHSIALFLLAGVGSLSAQVIQFRVQSSGSVFAVPNAGTLTMAAPARGQTAEVTVSAFYAGAKAASILKTELLGTSDYALGSTATPTLQPTDIYSFPVRYTASTANATQALLVVTYRETGGDIATAGFGISGTAPQVVATYSLPSDNNARTLASGGQLALPPVPVYTPAQATVTLNNTGSATATITGITASGSVFDLINLPLLPLTIDPARSISFNVRFQPTDPGSLAGTVQVNGPGSPFVFAVTGSAYAAQLSYTLVPDTGTPTAVTANSTLTFPSTLVGQQASLRLRLANQTPSSFTLSSISLSDSTNFQLPTLPVFPLILASGASLDVQANFVPGKGGIFNSQLRIGNDSILLTGAGLSSALDFSVVGPQGETLIAPGGTIPFPITAVGTIGTANVVIRNKTSAPVTLTAWSLANDRSAFAVTGTPQFPLTLQPSQSANFSVQFTPNTTGPFSGTVVFDTYSYTLVASATSPSSIPNLTIAGAPASVTALQQLPLSVSIDKVWPIDLVGDLTLSFDSGAFTIDPSVQFSTGGIKVSFKIPAGSLKATFANSSTLVRIQTGSVAGEIQVTPTLRTASSLDVGPVSASVLRLTVAPAAPTLFSIGLTTTGGVYLVQVTGISTPRSLGHAHLKFAPTGKIPFGTTDFTVDLTAVSNAWFRTTTSNSYGGLFTVSIPVSLTIPTSLATTALTLADVFKSITMDVDNSLGVSAPLTLTVQ